MKNFLRRFYVYGKYILSGTLSAFVLFAYLYFANILFHNNAAVMAVILLLSLLVVLLLSLAAFILFLHEKK